MPGSDLPVAARFFIKNENCYCQIRRDMVIYFPLGHSSEDIISIYEAEKKFWQDEARLHGQAVKTPPFHGGNRGSNPLGVTGTLRGVRGFEQSEPASLYPFGIFSLKGKFSALYKV